MSGGVRSKYDCKSVGLSLFRRSLFAG